jgi:predicted AAA+ superfamily ATPase
MLNNITRNHIMITGLTPRHYQRSFASEIDWSSPVIGLCGPRGVGKSTLLIQKYWTDYGDHTRCLYVSADHISVADRSLFSIAEEFYGTGGETLILDEVHRAMNWQKQVKSIIDTFRNKRLWLSGSSSAALTGRGADLSRRVPWHDMPGLSFREYLAFSDKIKTPAYSLEYILTHHVTLANELTSKIPVLQLFNQYLNHGYYPFFLEGLSTFELKVNAVLEKIVSEDIPAVFHVNPTSTPHLKRMIRMIASSKPFEPNIEGMANDLGVARDSVYHFLECLEKSKVIRSIRAPGSGGKQARKPAKILLENTSLLSTIFGRESLLAERCALRETFFASQLPTTMSATTGSAVDFIIQKTIGIEVGGPNKKDEQFKRESTKELTLKIIAQDGIEVGSGNVVPLYLFGFLR